MQTTVRSTIMAGCFSPVIFLIYLSFVSYGDGAEYPSALGYKYYAQISGWLKINLNSTDWVAARDSCRQEGAFLASDWTAEVASAVGSLQNNYQNAIPLLYSGERLIKMKSTEGGRCNETGMWDVVMQPIRWSKTEYCGVFYANGSTGYVDCKLRLPYVCYWSTTPPETPNPPTPPPVTTPAPRIPSCGNTIGYEYSNQTERCYKIHIQVLSWSNAKSTCEAEDARLAVPNSVKEAAVITAMHNRYLDSDINGTSWPDWTAVGVFWESNTWRTVDGDDLAQAGYEKWRSGWPSNMRSYPSVCMSRTGDYSNTSDNIKYPFVCEKSPSF